MLAISRVETIATLKIFRFPVSLIDKKKKKMVICPTNVTRQLGLFG